ncbi:MAG: hypothetical protein ICV79_07140 [Flavisolibacter sp.]|nr:hypothetical protein [Flavisolibacter sp.]
MSSIKMFYTGDVHHPFLKICCKGNYTGRDYERIGDFWSGKRQFVIYGLITVCCLLLTPHPSPLTPIPTLTADNQNNLLAKDAKP